MGKRNSVIDKLEIYVGDITSINGLDAIVNAAKPTLMGGGGVDGAIHKAVDSRDNHTTSFLKNAIKQKLDGDCVLPEDTIRCEYGNVKLTEGYGLATWIIHAVGSKYDGTETCMKELENCYKKIMDLVTEYNIKRIAIPIISSGKYKFPFSLASRIMITSISNYMVRLNKSDIERFSLIEKVYLVVYEDKNVKEFNEIFNLYKNNIVNGKQSIYRNVHESIQAYAKDILIYDTDKRGYFSITKAIRYLLSVYTYIFPVSLLLRQIPGGKNWETRRIVIELQVLIKIFIPLLFFLSYSQANDMVKSIFLWIIVYLMTETILYILSLIFLADIQKPSANVYRSILLLFVNYCEIILGFSFIYFALSYPNASIWESIDFGIMDIVKDSVVVTKTIHVLQYIKNFISISFLGLTFSYFSSNFKQRAFKS